MTNIIKGLQIDSSERRHLSPMEKLSSFREKSRGSDLQIRKNSVRSALKHLNNAQTGAREMKQYLNRLAEIGQKAEYHWLSKSDRESYVSDVVRLKDEMQLIAHEKLAPLAQSNPERLPEYLNHYITRVLGSRMDLKFDLHTPDTLGLEEVLIDSYKNAADFSDQTAQAQEMMGSYTEQLGAVSASFDRVNKALARAQALPDGAVGVSEQVAPLSDVRALHRLGEQDFKEFLHLF